MAVPAPAARPARLGVASGAGHALINGGNLGAKGPVGAGRVWCLGAGIGRGLPSTSTFRWAKVIV